eukprot:6375511-Prymnesium_polylepis.2
MQNKQEYCDVMGYQLLMQNKRMSPDRRAEWDKILALHTVAFDSAAGCEWVVWVDSDVVFMRPSALLPAELLQSDATSIGFTVAATGLCNGVQAIRTNSLGKRFLVDVWDEHAKIPRHVRTPEQ